MKTVFGKTRQDRTLARKGIQMDDLLKAAFYGLPAVAFSIGLAFWAGHLLGKRKKKQRKVSPSANAHPDHAKHSEVILSG